MCDEINFKRELGALDGGVRHIWSSKTVPLKVVYSDECSLTSDIYVLKSVSIFNRAGQILHGFFHKFVLTHRLTSL